MSPRRLAAALWWAVGARLFAAEAEPEPQAEVQVCVVPVPVALAMYVSTPDSSPARAYVKSLVPSAEFEDEEEGEEPCA